MASSLLKRTSTTCNAAANNTLSSNRDSTKPCRSPYVTTNYSECSPSVVRTYIYICIVQDSREFRTTEGSTKISFLVFGVKTALWSTAVKKAGKRYRGVLEAAERFMVRWHEDEAELSRQRSASAVGGAQGNGGRGGNRGTGRTPDQGNAGRGGNRKSRRETAVGGSMKETTDRVQRHQID